MPEPWRIAIIDSGVDREPRLHVLQQQKFVGDGARVTQTPSTGDLTGHGTTIATIIASAPTFVELISAQVLNAHGRSTAATVAAALSWSLTQRATLIHLSLGLSQDRSVLAERIAQAIDSGVIIVASSPARGARTFPTSYPGVIRATGDARCALEEISHLNTTSAHFGACVRHTRPDSRQFRGASIGAAHLTRFLVSRLTPGTPARDIHACLSRLAAYRGLERICAVTTANQ